MPTFSENCATIAAAAVSRQEPPDAVMAEALVQGAGLIERAVVALERIAVAQTALAADSACSLRGPSPFKG